MRSEVMRFCVLVGCALLWGGCGGGTTGTSSTGVVRLSGSVRTEGGAPVANRPMAVVSADSGAVLLDSSTDQRGRFVMLLPEQETAADILISGASNVELRRSIAEVSLASAAVVVRPATQPDGVAQSVLTAQLEARVVGAACSGSLFTPVELDARSVGAGEPCRIEVEVAAAGSDAVEIKTVCRTLGGDIALFSAGVARVGVFEVDLAPVLGSSCTSREVRISVASNPDAMVVIPVQR